MPCIVELHNVIVLSFEYFFLLTLSSAAAWVKLTCVVRVSRCPGTTRIFREAPRLWHYALSCGFYRGIGLRLGLLGCWVLCCLCLFSFPFWCSSMLPVYLGCAFLLDINIFFILCLLKKEVPYGAGIFLSTWGHVLFCFTCALISRSSLHADAMWHPKCPNTSNTQMTQVPFSVGCWGRFSHFTLGCFFRKTLSPYLPKRPMIGLWLLGVSCAIIQPTSQLVSASLGHYVSKTLPWAGKHPFARTLGQIYIEA